MRGRPFSELEFESFQNAFMKSTFCHSYLLVWHCYSYTMLIGNTITLLFDIQNCLTIETVELEFGQNAVKRN